MTSWLQIMSVGGNGRARQFFKQHGWTELGADKIEQKVRSWPLNSALIKCCSSIAKTWSALSAGSLLSFVFSFVL